MVEYLKLLTDEDYKKLINNDLGELKKLIPELKETIYDERTWLKNNIEEIEDVKAIEIIKNKVFAGQITIKLYKVNTIISRDEIIKRLESDEFKFNKVEILAEEKISIYSTLYIDENKYLIRLRYDNGERSSYGHKFPDVRYINVFYHVNEKVLEVRSDISKSKRIIDFLNKKLNIGVIQGMRVLRKHKSIEDFAAAIDGHFNKISSNTALEIGELEEEDIVSLGNLVLAIDDFLSNSDVTTFIEKLEMLKFNTKLTFTQAFLAGCNQIGISVSNQLKGDLRNQGLYKVLSKHLSNENGYISFSSNADSKEVTIRLSTKINTNTVQFVSSVTENEISIIVKNIIEGIRSNVIDADEIKELSTEVQQYIQNPQIKAIRPEFLIENFKLEEDTVIGILEGYVNEGYISMKLELTGKENSAVSREYNSIVEMRSDIEFIVDEIDSDYKFIDDDEYFLEEYEDFINVKYNIVKRDAIKSDEDAVEVISKQIELQMKNNIKKEIEKESPKKKLNLFDSMKARLATSFVLK